MSTNTLNSSIKQQLFDNLGYSPSDITTIQTSPTLVSLLNSFNGKLIYKPSYPGAYHQGNDIVLGKAPYNSLSTLAHELGHATGQYQSGGVGAYGSAAEYSKARTTGEGEAIYYQFVVIEELRIKSYTHY